MENTNEIRVHQIWLGLQVWEKLLAIFIPIIIGVTSGMGSGAFYVGMYKQRIEMTLSRQDEDILNIKKKVDEVQNELKTKVSYSEFYETKKKADESRESLIELKADVGFIHNNTNRILNEIEKIRDRR